MNSSQQQRGVYPPSFCDWRLALGIMALTEVSVLLVGLGRYQGITWQWLSIISAYAQSLALLPDNRQCPDDASSDHEHGRSRG